MSPSPWAPFVTSAHDTVCDSCRVHATCDICHREVGYSTRYYVKTTGNGDEIVHATCVEETTPRGTRERKRSAEIKAIIARSVDCDACKT
jgi:hypothetical protein